jgi:hypothetical protein
MGMYDSFYFADGILPDNKEDASTEFQTKDLEWNTHTWYNQTENKSVSHSEKELEVLYPEHNISHLLMEYVLTGFKEFRTMCQPLSPSTDFSKIVSQCCGIRLNRYNVNTLMRQHFDHIHSLFDGAQKGVPVLSAIGVLNDDYEGGEIEFWADGKAIRYKPKAGDILVFPSGNPLFPGDGRPYFHSVCSTGRGEKYLFRAFGKYTDPITTEWTEGVERFGEELWKAKVSGTDLIKKDVYSKAGPALMTFDKGVATVSRELLAAYGGKMKGEYGVRG